MKALPTLRKPASQVGFDWAPLLCELPLTTEIADVAALALPEFDDPNIDKDEAIAGVLGNFALHITPSLSHQFAEDDSPYPEVRSAVANTDDPTIPASSLRTWVLGLFWAIIIPVSIRTDGPYTAESDLCFSSGP